MESTRLLEWVPTTRHGKNRLKQHGKYWELIEDRGDTLLLRSLTFSFQADGKLERDMRIVPKDECKDFEV